MASTVLIVEDDDNVQRFLTDLLEEEGYAVVCEKDGEWGLKAIERRSFDFIILDVLLPGINGFDLAEKIRAGETSADVPILMISGIYRSARHRRECIERYQVVDYLDKPLASAKVVAAVQKGIGVTPSGKLDKDHSSGEHVAAERLADRASQAEKKEVESAARSDFQGGKVTRGNLQETPFAALMAQIYRWKATGALLLKRSKIKKIVYFKDGYPSYIKSNVLNECLGKVMVRERLISENDCEESIKLMRSTQRQQGTVLIEMGCISPHNLVYALELQLQAKLFDVFSWPDGEYQFNPKSSPPSEIIELEMTPATIIYEGIKRTHSSEQLERLLESYMDSFLIVHPDPLQRFQEMDLSANERRLIALIDGKKSLSLVLERGQLLRDRAMALTYALIVAQMVMPQERRASQREQLEPPALKVTKTKASKAPPPPPPEPPKHLVAPPPTPGRHAKEREQLAIKAKEMRKMDYFEMLGVSKTASNEEIKKAYYALTRDYHPDKHYGRASADVRALADQIYTMINAAFEVLSDAYDRESYTRDLETGLKQGPVDDVSRILSAEGAFQKGEGFLKKRQYAQAITCFREALDLYGEEGEFHAFLGWALFQSDPNNEAVQRRAEDMILKGIEFNPRVDKAYLFLGFIYKATSRARDAEAQFEKAIKCNPDCTEALRELRLIEQTRERSRKPSLFKN